ncbi:MAG: hypothetical protein Tsb009_18500 [Planctomycetaceae bacterium]
MQISSSKYILVSMSVLFLIGAGETPTLKSAKKSPEILQITIHPVLPINKKSPEIIVRYHNTGSKPVELNLPFIGNSPFLKKLIQKKLIKRNDIKHDETWTFRRLSVTFDGQKAEFQQKLSPIDDFARTRYEKIPPGKHVDLKLNLKTIYKIPEDWRTIQIKTSNINFIEAKVIGNLVIYHVRHTFSKPIYVTAEPVVPVNFADPRIRIRYQNIGKKTFQLPLPKPGNETKIFWDATAKIDRKEVWTFVKSSPEGGYKKWMRLVELEAGESTEIIIRLKDYYKIPKDWKLIEIPSERFLRMQPEYADTLILTRPLQCPIDVPVKVWSQSNDNVRWFLVEQQKLIQKLKKQQSQK